MVLTILRWHRQDDREQIHKYPRWKQLLKGFFDTHADRVRVVVTGSSRLDVYRRGGDSLMGRYFFYRMHPFSVAETLHQEIDAPHAFQVVIDADYVGQDCFASAGSPVAAPARTLLSQLL